MSDPSEWIKDLLSEEDIANITAKAERILDDEGTYYEMTVAMTKADMVSAVRTGYGMQEGDMDAWLMGVSILMALLKTMEDRLEQDGVDVWEDNP